MNTKTLSSRALSVIDQYMHFKSGTAVCSVPYFNNRASRARAALRPYIGKGSPQDIHEETLAIALKHHISLENLADESLKKLLSDEGLGIDCSGFAYYVLNAENQEKDKGQLDKHISFVHCKGLLGKIRCSLRPVENCGVLTFADDRNSRILPLSEVQPGDIITMTGSTAAKDPANERDHILVIHQVEYQNFTPMKIHYSHAVAYPEDGLYGSGIRQGAIEFADPNGAITSGIWTEDGKTGNENRIFRRASSSKTEIRRLKWW